MLSTFACNHFCCLNRSTARGTDDAAAQMAAAAEHAGGELLETWLILEYCDQGSFDAAIRHGRFRGDLVRSTLL